MMRSRCVLFVVNLILPLAVTAGEKKINRSELPPAVQKTVGMESQGAIIRGFSKETEGARTYYEVELIMSGHRKDVLMDSQGAIVEVEEEVALDSLSSRVRDGLRTKAGSGKIRKVESLTKLGAVVAYEAQVVNDGRRSEIKVGPDGKPL